MFCRYCGRQILDDASFCCYCGKRLEQRMESNSVGENNNKIIDNEKISLRYNNRKKNKRFIGSLVLLSVIVIAVFMVLVTMNRKKQGVKAESYENTDTEEEILNDDEIIQDKENSLEADPIDNKILDVETAQDICSAVVAALCNEEAYDEYRDYVDKNLDDSKEYIEILRFCDKDHINTIDSISGFQKEVINGLTEKIKINYTENGASQYTVASNTDGIIYVFIGTDEDEFKWQIIPKIDVEYEEAYSVYENEYLSDSVPDFNGMTEKEADLYIADSLYNAAYCSLANEQAYDEFQSYKNAQDEEMVVLYTIDKSGKTYYPASISTYGSEIERNLKEFVGSNNIKLHYINDKAEYYTLVALKDELEEMYVYIGTSDNPYKWKIKPDTDEFYLMDSVETADLIESEISNDDLMWKDTYIYELQNIENGLSDSAKEWGAGVIGFLYDLNSDGIPEVMFDKSEDPTMSEFGAITYIDGKVEYLPFNPQLYVLNMYYGNNCILTNSYVGQMEGADVEAQIFKMDESQMYCDYYIIKNNYSDQGFAEPYGIIGTTDLNQEEESEVDYHYVINELSKYGIMVSEQHENKNGRDIYSYDFNYDESSFRMCIFCSFDELIEQIQAY